MSFSDYFQGYREMFPCNLAIQMAIQVQLWRGYLSFEDFGERVGVSGATVRNWAFGKVKHIHHNNMAKLWPAVQDQVLEFMHQGIY